MAGDDLDFDFDDIETHKSADSNIQRCVESQFLSHTAQDVDVVCTSKVDKRRCRLKMFLILLTLCKECKKRSMLSNTKSLTSIYLLI